ncbi:M16 family metallopeptidase [Salinimicrobium sp. WS361]|uniref:M16 family metallopeptidase n=1 Tax=Salinimicrobium sp. WS361 TaxID=3425123 RepID=UPI003D6E953C
MKKILFTLLLASLPSGLLAQDTTSSIKVEEIPMDPKVKIGVLDNGLTYYIRKNSEPQKRAQLYLVLKAGSIQENDDQKGLAHFTEHMAFNGTKSFPKNELIDYLQKAGIRFGADLNAYTSFEETVYQLPLPTDEPELFKSGFRILSEWAGNITFDNEEIDKERGVVISEERQRGKNVSERISKQLLPVLLADSRYEDRLPIGEIEIIENFDYETLKNFYRDWYRPDLQAVIAVGDFDVKMVEELIRKNFSGLPKSNGKPKKEHYDIPSNEKPLVKIVTDPEFPYTVASVIYKHPATVTTNTEDFRNSVIKSAVSSMLSRRISEKIQSGSAAYLNAGASYGSYQGGIANLDAFTLQVVAKEPGLLKDAIEGIMDEVHSMEQYGFTQTEFDRVKESFMTSVIKSHAEKDKTSSKHYVNQLVEHFTKGEAVIDMDYSLDFYNTYLAGISLEEVNQMADSFVTERKQIILVQASEKDKELLPTEQDLLEWVNSKREISAYEDDFVDGPLVNEALTGSKVLKSVEHAVNGTTEIELSNGVQVILKPTDFKNDQILFSSFSPGGYSLASEDELHSSKMAAGIISSSGIGEYTSTQLDKMLTGKTVSISSFISTYFEGIKGSSSPKDLKTALELIYLFYTKPRKDSIPFKRILENTRVSLEGKSANPMSVFQDTINAVMQGNGPWATELSLQNIDKVSLEEAYDFYTERFADASDFTFTFVGNFEKDSIIPLLETYLGSLPATNSKEDFRDVGIEPIPGNITRVVHRGLEEKAVVVLTYHDQYEYEQMNNTELNMIKSSLETKLLKRLREKESGVYSPSVGLSKVKIPSSYYLFSISFSCAPERVDELIEATKDEIALLRREGPTQDELDKFIAQEQRQKETQLRSNSYWLNYIQNVYQGEIEMDYIQNYNSYLEALTLSRLKKASKKYLSTENSARLVLLPENNI